MAYKYSLVFNKFFCFQANIYQVNKKKTMGFGLKSITFSYENNLLQEITILA